jgi:hypothetical protein
VNLSVRRRGRSSQILDHIISPPNETRHMSYRRPQDDIARNVADRAYRRRHPTVLVAVSLPQLQNRDD